MMHLFAILYVASMVGWTALLVGMPLLIGAGLVWRIVGRHHDPHP